MSSRGLRGLVAAAVAVAAGNLAILAAVDRARRRVARRNAPGLDGVKNAHRVSDRLLRSGWPGPDGYTAAAGLGVRTVVDLRAEGGAGPGDDLGVEHVRIPIRDGQPPTASQVEQFRNVMQGARGPVLVHCAAGVGRTGSLLAAYEIAERGVEPAVAARRMLAVGPSSLEQIAFVLGGGRRPPLPIVVLSRLLDAPRRSWSRIRGALREH